MAQVIENSVMQAALLVIPSSKMYVYSESLMAGEKNQSIVIRQSLTIHRHSVVTEKESDTGFLKVMASAVP